MFKKISQLIEQKQGAERAYKNYKKATKSPFLRQLAAEATRENVREIKREYKKITKQN
jgi:hypothetical protein